MNSPVPAADLILYWGVDGSGNYFETLPVDASNPANVGVRDPQHSLPQNTAAKPMFIRDSDSKVLTGDDARAAMKQEVAATAAGGFVCSRNVSGMTIIARVMTGSTQQQRALGGAAVLGETPTADKPKARPTANRMCLDLRDFRNVPVLSFTEIPLQDRGRFEAHRKQQAVLDFPQL